MSNGPYHYRQAERQLRLLDVEDQVLVHAILALVASNVKNALNADHPGWLEAFGYTAAKSTMSETTPVPDE